jgi:hypothetical protein
MVYEIPLQSGIYRVNFYIGNQFHGADGVGDRIFDIEMEGGLEHVGVDPVALFGHQSGGMLSKTITVNDGVLSIRFLHRKENPLINGIEIITEESSISKSIALLGKTTSAEKVVSENQGLESLEIVPNPVSRGGNLNIHTSLVNSKSGFVEIFDLHGRQLKTTPLHLEQGNQVTGLPIIGLSKGIYIVRFRFGHFRLNRKIIIN